MNKNNLLKKIKSSIEETFGNRFDYSLIGIKKDFYILVTPFLNNKNDFIEIGISARDENNLMITDFGITASYVLSKERSDDSRKHIADVIKKMTGYFGVSFEEGEFRIQTDFKKAGDCISNLLKSLQKIYNLDIAMEGEKKKFDKVFRETYKNNYKKKQNHKDIFKREVVSFLKERSIEFIEDYSIEGLSGDIKIIDLKIASASHRLIRILSTKDINRAKDMVKICHSDFTDILNKHKKIAAGIIYNDKHAPDIWNNCLMKETFKILKSHNIRKFGFYSEREKVNIFLK